MRSSGLLCLIPAALYVAASPSPADVTISNAATTNMTCSGGVCSPTAANAVLNVQTLEAMLASGPATVKTTGAGVQAKDIEVKAPLIWSAGTTLALDAFQSIEVNSHVTVAGAGSISLTANDGGSRGEFACNHKGRLEFSKLSSTLNFNGTSYVLVDSVASLATAVNTNPGGAFALARNYNAKKDGTYTSSPIAPVFVGSFNGLGNTISNLSINDQTEDATVALFAETWTGSVLANIRLMDETVRGVSGSAVGGLVANAGGAIANSFNSGKVSGGPYSQAGGLLGDGNSTTVTGSGSTADVSGGDVGGLIATLNAGSISDSWATGNVSGKNPRFGVGGLVGFTNTAAIKHSWASGQVSGIGNGLPVTGGLVGNIEFNALIERSHASGAVSCMGYCGGLVGWEGSGGDNGINAMIVQSYATGAVTATSVGLDPTVCAGGLVGWKEIGDISNSYALGVVTAIGSSVPGHYYEQCSGGLVGRNDGGDQYRSISTSYATGAVNGSGIWQGGLIGDDGDGDFGSAVKRNYWNMTTSGITNPSQGAGNIANARGIKGLSDRKLKSGLPNGFEPKIWKEDSSINNGWPYLINNPPAN